MLLLPVALSIFLNLRRPRSSTLFPYTRSSDLERGDPPARSPAVLLGREPGESERCPADDDRGRAPLHGHRQGAEREPQDRKSTRLNSSHTVISYAVFCLKKKIYHMNDGIDPAC